MAKQAELTYLFQSGFLVKLHRRVLIFDYFRDDTQAAQAALGGGLPGYVFCSHAHFDHFSPAVASFAPQVERYFLSFDIKNAPGAGQIPAQKATYLNAYDHYEDGAVRVTTFSSTDEGVSFLVEAEGWRIFHAGDFNWWHWKGDTRENNAFAKNGFMKQMKKLDGLEADIAFFPVDGRLEEFWDLGVKEFCRRTKLGYLVTMHNTVQGGIWNPPADLFGDAPVAVWSPAQAGESIKIIK